MLKPAQFEIFEANLRLGNVNYPRPCIVIAVPSKGQIAALPISGAMDLYRGLPTHFPIRTSDPDFAKTGLKKDCYVMGEETAELEIQDLIRKRGQLEGELLQRFKLWFE